MIKQFLKKQIFREVSIHLIVNEVRQIVKDTFSFWDPKVLLWNSVLFLNTGFDL